uniref:Polynucleotide kinase PNKP phosphatase domain-containing protein n=1 Tax=viral metagenome TaxID=1070528 RepID=A0A6M3IFQ0_9ZZZZ
MLKRYTINKSQQKELEINLRRMKKEEEKKKKAEIVQGRRVIVEGLPSAIICDIDGTLATRCDRDIFDNSKVEGDFVVKEVKYILNLINFEEKNKIILVSGRENVCEKETLNWLHKHGIPFDFLYMRGKDDRREDYVVKEEIYKIHILPRYNVLFALEDRKQVKKLWVKLGIFVLDVNQTDEVF